MNTSAIGHPAGDQELLAPGTMLAEKRYCLQRRLMVYPLTDQTQEILWLAQDCQEKTMVLLHELRLTQVDFPTRQQAVRTILQVRAKLAPTLAGVHDFFSQGDHLYFTTQAPRGQTLAHRLVAGVFSEREALQCALDLCDLEEVLVQQGLFHGCLSPDSLIQTETGRWTVTHLPLISLLLAKQMLTRPPAWPCAPIFPGVRSGTKEADVDALLALTFFALKGNWPKHEAFSSGRSLPGQMAGDFLQLFASGFHPEVMKRYQTVADLRQDLEKMYARRGGHRSQPVQRGRTSGRLRGPFPSEFAPYERVKALGASPIARASSAYAHPFPTPARPFSTHLSGFPDEDISSDQSRDPHSFRTFVGPQSRMDSLVPACWIIGLNALLLFLATRGG